MGVSGHGSGGGAVVQVGIGIVPDLIGLDGSAAAGRRPGEADAAVENGCPEVGGHEVGGGLALPDGEVDRDKKQGGNGGCQRQGRDQEPQSGLA